MVEPQRLDTVKQYITLARPLDQEAVKAYLSICTEEELIPLVEMLTSMERQEGRTLLIDVLAELGKKHVDVFARRLEHNASNVVKDMLAIIQKIDPANKYQDHRQVPRAPERDDPDRGAEDAGQVAGRALAPLHREGDEGRGHPDAPRCLSQRSPRAARSAPRRCS